MDRAPEHYENKVLSLDSQIDMVNEGIKNLDASLEEVDVAIARVLKGLAEYNILVKDGKYIGVSGKEIQDLVEELMEIQMRGKEGLQDLKQQVKGWNPGPGGYLVLGKRAIVAILGVLMAFFFGSYYGAKDG